MTPAVWLPCSLYRTTTNSAWGGTRVFSLGVLSSIRVRRGVESSITIPTPNLPLLSLQQYSGRGIVVSGISTSLQWNLVNLDLGRLFWASSTTNDNRSLIRTNYWDQCIRINEVSLYMKLTFFYPNGPRYTNVSFRRTHVSRVSSSCNY